MKYILLAILIVCSNNAISDDIDLYIKNTSDTVPRPNVLIILDNSPSMVWYPVGSDERLGDGNEHVNNPETRAHKAREIVIDLINDNPEVDFALQLFNSNNDGFKRRDGGRIVFGFKDLSVATNKSSLITILDDDTDNSNNNYTDFVGNGTPLCETLYETYRYLSGGNLYYGNDDKSTPKSIISSGKYVSPFANIKCNKEINIIYITDGDPTLDDNANGKVKTLTGADDDDSDSETGNFLGVLGNWMATRNWISGKQIENTAKNEILASVKIHTVGFGGGVNATNLLKDAARDGIKAIEKDGFYDYPAGGTFYEASTAEALKKALQNVVLEVLDSSSLTSASVSANSFDRTQTLDSVFYGMFEPTSAARWQGNLKKYKILNGNQVDADSKPATNSAGEFNDTAESFWSSSVDGNEVGKGGVAEMLRATDADSRTYLTDINGVNQDLSEFSEVKLEEKYTSNASLTNAFGIDESDVGDIDDHIKWAMGIDVDDDDDDSSTTDIRSDVFGDPLHSKPIVINYGTGNPRIIIGTNSGVLHMFEDEGNTVKENWAYLPQEFFKNIKPLRENIIAIDNKIYGLDGEIKLHVMI